MRGGEVVYAVVNAGAVLDMYRPDPRWRIVMSQSVVYVYTHIFSPFLCAQGLLQHLSRQFCSEAPGLIQWELRQLSSFFHQNVSNVEKNSIYDNFHGTWWWLKHTPFTKYFSQITVTFVGARSHCVH